jgi:homocysteine S-methyltransferase
VAPQNPLAPFLEPSGVVLLDGGLATELEARGHDLGTALWSARLLMDDPETIRSVHEAYLEAGADCIVTASYQASFAGFALAGLTESDAAAALRRSSELALAARGDHRARHPVRAGVLRDAPGDRSSAATPASPPTRASPPPPLVAASIGPYGAFLADGSEYDGRYGVDREALAAFHRRRFHLLADSGVDLLACETLPTRLEAEVLLSLLAEHESAWAWLSFTCQDGERLRDGSDFTEAVEACANHERVAAVGVNCTDPRHVAELTRRASSVTELPLVVYANSGERWDATARSWRPPARLSAEDASSDAWLSGMLAAHAAGARVLGGCCRIGPGGIGELRRALVGGD